MLGEGTSAVVLRGIETATGLPVAVKRVALSTLSPAELKQVSQEIAFLQQYRHPNIIRLLDLQRTDEQFLLVLEYAESDLFSYITRTGALKVECVSRSVLRSVRFSRGHCTCRRTRRASYSARLSTQCRICIAIALRTGELAAITRSAC